MEKTVLVPVADGSEELETVAIVDVLRRAGAQVVIAAVKDMTITGSKEVKLMADRKLQDCLGEVFDLIVLPGGMPGAENLRDSQDLIRLLKGQEGAGRYYAAICASPVVVLHPNGLLREKRFPATPVLLREYARARFRAILSWLMETSLRAGGPAQPLHLPSPW
jgi:protein deglycase